MKKSLIAVSAILALFAIASSADADWRSEKRKCAVGIGKRYQMWVTANCGASSQSGYSKNCSSASAAAGVNCGAAGRANISGSFSGSGLNLATDHFEGNGSTGPNLLAGPNYGNVALQADGAIDSVANQVTITINGRWSLASTQVASNRFSAYVWIAADSTDSIRTAAKTIWYGTMENYMGGKHVVGGSFNASDFPVVVNNADSMVVTATNVVKAVPFTAGLFPRVVVSFEGSNDSLTGVPATNPIGAAAAALILCTAGWFFIRRRSASA